MISDNNILEHVVCFPDILQAKVEENIYIFKFIYLYVFIFTYKYEYIYI